MFAQKNVSIEFKITMRDGNFMSGTSKIDKVTLETKFGKLIIPIQNVTSIEMGIMGDDSKKSDMLNKAKLLSNEDETIREKAYQELVDMGISAIPVLNEYVYSTDYSPTDYNTIYTVENALRELKTLYNVLDSDPLEDVVTIDYNYKIGGKSSITNISLKTEYGVLEIPRNKIKKMDIMYIDNDDTGSKKFMLMASTHISGNTNGGWLNTGILVKPGQKINITANGEIVLASLSNGKYNPDGKVGSSYTGDTSYPTYGNVVFKIGENGEVKRAGSNYNGIADSSGILYISIYETVYNSANTGSYVVKVSVK
ncbi:MAG: hypothetical protein Kow0068_23070 [Marinilabiliales bacterium]